MKKKPWTPEEIEELKRRYPNERTEDICKDLNRPISSVYGKASGLGLKKSKAFLESENSGRANLLQHGVAHRFKKGHHSWNQ